MATSLNNIATLYTTQKRYSEAAALLKRAILILEKSLGLNHPAVGTSVNNLAELYRVEGRFAEAEPLHKRALAIREKALGPDHPDVGMSLNNLALLEITQGRHAEAEPIIQSSITISEKVLGPDHPTVGLSLNNLAFVYLGQGRNAEARSVFLRSLAVFKRALGADHPSLVIPLFNLAALYQNEGQYAQAVEYLRQSAELLTRRSRRTPNLGAHSLAGQSQSEAVRANTQFSALVKTLWQLTTDTTNQGKDIIQETFIWAQWAATSEAAASLAQMAARQAKGNTRLAVLVRERQDLVREWQFRDKLLISAVTQPPDKRKLPAEHEQRARLVAIDARISDIDRTFVNDFPDHAAIDNPPPLTITDVQALLRPDEALVSLLDTPEWKPTPEESFIWVVTKTDMRWVRSALGTSALTREVAALRCGLDRAAWHADGATRCADLLQINADNVPKQDTPLPFDLARAHALYTGLFGQVEDLMKGKQLLLVPSGPLTQVPFQVLVTSPPTAGAYKSAAWLARSHAITVLPAVSSLKALRRVAKPSAATLPMIGFGNPLLDGDQKHPELGGYHKKQAALARAYKGCAHAVAQRSPSLRRPGRGLTPIPQHGGLVDLAQVRLAAPLPETADELCAVAHDLNIDVNEIRLGERATERDVKALSASGKLAQYRIVHFATHGTLAGQLTGVAEPGLILTPPVTATEEDDGYLSASEISGLKLDADWVILSACNTAGPAGGWQATSGAAGTEALGGLARAFFYAQARALLVSHWEVDSNATVKLITKAVGAGSLDKSVGRAEALRRSMLAMIDQGPEAEAHPSMWAPFVVVGEGATAVQEPSNEATAGPVPTTIAAPTPPSKPTGKPQVRKKSPSKAKTLAKGATEDWRSKAFGQ